MKVEGQGREKNRSKHSETEQRRRSKINERQAQSLSLFFFFLFALNHSFNFSFSILLCTCFQSSKIIVRISRGKLVLRWICYSCSKRSLCFHFLFSFHFSDKMGPYQLPQCTYRKSWHYIFVDVVLQLCVLLNFVLGREKEESSGW